MNRRTLDRLYSDLPGYGLNPLPYSAHCQIVQHLRVPLIDVGTIDAIRSGAEDGMQDFTQSLKSLVDLELIDRETAMEVAPNREAL